MLGAQVLPQVGVGVGACVRGLSTRVQVVHAAVVSPNSLAHGSLGSQLCCSAWKGGHISLRSLRIAPTAQRKPGLASWWPVLPPCPSMCSCLFSDCGPPAIQHRVA